MIMKSPKDPAMSIVCHKFGNAMQFVFVTLIVLSSAIHQTATARPANEIRIQRHIAVTMRDGVNCMLIFTFRLLPAGIQQLYGAHPMEFNGMDHMKR